MFGLHNLRPWVRLPAIPGIFQGKIIDVTKVNRQWCLERGLWFENVGRTHLVQISSKLILFKVTFFYT